VLLIAALSYHTSLGLGFVFSDCISFCLLALPECPRNAFVVYKLLDHRDTFSPIRLFEQFHFTISQLI